MIKKVIPDEWQKFRDIRLAGLQEAPQSFGGNNEEESKRNEEEWRKRFEKPDRIHFVVEENNAFVSTAGMIKTDEGDWMIVAVYTRPEFRGKGIATKIISELINEAKKQGAAKMILEVNTDEKSAVHLYKKLGFEIVREEKDHMMGDGKLHDIWGMEKIF